MGKLIETIVSRFDGGITNNPRDPASNVARMVTNFDILTNPHKLIPYRDSEDGDQDAATQKNQSFAVGRRTGTTYSMYGLGVVSGTARAEVNYKNLTTGAATDLDDDDWASPSGDDQSLAGTANFELFTYYQRTNRLYGARAGTHIFSYLLTAAGWVDSEADLTAYTNVANGLVHSKDDILYVPYDNKIAKNSNGSWTVPALTLPTHFYITSICEYGNFIAIGCAPLSGIGNSRVYLWDRNASLTTLSESIDWGSGVLKVLEEIDGILIGISLEGSSTIAFKDRIYFRAYTGGTVQTFKTLYADDATGTVLPITKQKVNNRVYFLMKIVLNGATRTGVWSVGRSSPDSPFVLVHERTQNNDTALGAGVLKGFHVLGDYTFIAYTTAAGDLAMSKTNDQSSFTATSIYESKIFNAGDSSLKKDLLGTTVTTEYLPANGQVVLKYATDEDIGTDSWTTIFTDTTDNSISHSAVNIESSGAALPRDYKEIAFRIESTGGAEITGLSFMEEITAKRTYMALFEAIINWGASLIRR